MSTHVIEEVFPAGDQPALKVSNIAGRVTITGAPISEIRVEARKHNNGDAKNTIVHIAQREDGCVEIKVEQGQGPLSWMLTSNVCSVDFDIQVPHNCKVNASVVSADLEASHLQGALQITGVSGEIELEELDGDLSISTVSGEVEAEKLRGKLHLNTVSGDVVMNDSDLSTLKVSTVSADIKLESAIHLDGAYRLSSVSGSIDWTVPQDIACRIKSSSISGRIYVTSQAGKQRYTAGNHHNLTLGESGPEIHLSSISGDLRIHTSLADLAANPPAAV